MVELADDLLIAVGGGDIRRRGNALFRLCHRGGDDLVNVGIEAFGLSGYGQVRGGGEECGDELRERHVALEVHADESDDALPLADHRDRHGFKGAPLPPVEVDHGVRGLAFLNVVQHGERQVGDRRAHLALGVMTVDDFNYRVAQLLQTVEYDLIAVAKIERETVQHILVGPKDLTIHFCQLKFFWCHRFLSFLEQIFFDYNSKNSKVQQKH